MPIYTKATLIEKLREIRAMGWVKTGRPGNDGGVGNTLEDLLGIPENNFAVSNTNEWELKSQRSDTASLVTMFHLDPSPRKARLVAGMLLTQYGWPHQDPRYVWSFRATISGPQRTDRGFAMLIDRPERKISLSFQSSIADPRHSGWLKSVERRIGLGELQPQPYWGFDDLYHKAQVKISNVVFVTAKRERREGEEFFLYDKVALLSGFNFDRFVNALESGEVKVDFDVRTGKNHGVKFRTTKARFPTLYNQVIDLDAPALH
jgi:hypothetical protein